MRARRTDAAFFKEGGSKGREVGGGLCEKCVCVCVWRGGVCVRAITALECTSGFC